VSIAENIKTMSTIEGNILVVKPEYLTAVQSAVQFIESNLHDPELGAQSVAAHCGFSVYHFHRIFSAALGESVKDYLRKRRLMVGAQDLRSTDKAIIELAWQSGFESQEAFTRAFRKMFGTTPGAYRRMTGLPSPVRKSPATEKLIEHLTGGITMQPKFVTRGPELAIGMAGSFAQGDTERISALWQDFVKRMPAIKHQKPYSLGVCMSNHPDVVKTSGDTFVYVAALPVTQVNDLPDGMVICDIPEATYALFTHKGAIADIKHTVEYIWGTWVPESGCQLLDSPDFELYDERFDPQSGTGEVDIYVPVKR
jgi:AraC family transcriptional regulator